MDRGPRLILTCPETDVICACFWRNCRHKRRNAAENTTRRLQYEQINALTDEDVAWLREMGWNR